MKKIFSFLTAILFVGTMWAGDVSVTIATSSDGSNWTAKGASGSGNTTTVIKNGITVSSTKGYYTSAHIREYSGSVITVSSTEGNIKTIEFTSTASTGDYNPNKLSLKSGQAGSYSTSSNKGTWSFGTGTSNVSSVTFNATAQFRWTQVVVTYIGSDNPSVSVDPSSLTFGPVGLNDAAPAAQEFTITGSNLTAALTVTSSNTSLYAVSVKEGSSLTPQDKSVSAIIVVTPQAAITGSVGTKEATITVAGGGLAEADQKTVALSTEVKAKHNIIFNTDLVDIDNVSVMEGGTYNITETINETLIENCTYKTFEGWTTTSTVTTGQSAKPVIASSVTMGTEDVNLYPVFSGTSGSSAATLTKMAKGDEFANGDNIVIVANGTTIALYQETTNTSYVQTWSFENDVETVAADAKNYVTVSTATNGWYLGDDTNGYLNNSSNNLYCNETQSVWTLTDNNDGTFRLVANSRWLSYRSDLSTKKWRMGGATSGEPSGDANLDIYKYSTGGSKTYSSDPVCNASQCEAPSFSPAAGTYYEAKTVELSTLTADASIYYTTNGDEPTTGSTLYNNESKISVSQSMTIKAIAVKAGMTNSDVASATYTLKCAQPTITKNAALFLETATVTIASETAEVEIRYTTNGDEPTASSTLYENPFEITDATTVKAIAIKTGWENSAIAEATFAKDILLESTQAIYDKAVEIGGTPADVNITFNNWVISGAKGATVFITDGTKGFEIGGASNGFAAGDKLSGTAACKLALISGHAKVTGLTSTSAGLTVTNDGVIDTLTLDAEGIAGLAAVNTGRVISVSGACTQVDSKYYVAGVQLYTSLFTYEAPTVDKNYIVTGVYVRYNDVNEILPRVATDVKLDTSTALDNTEAGVKAVKVLREGQIFILRGEKVYTLQGQLVK